MMRHVAADKLTELEVILLRGLLHSCAVGCSHEGCRSTTAGDRAYKKALEEAIKYRPAIDEPDTTRSKK